MMDWLGTVSEFRGSFDSSRLEPPHRITLPRATWLDLLGYCQKHNASSVLRYEFAQIRFMGIDFEVGGSLGVQG